jgi:hypothetical protein
LPCRRSRARVPSAARHSGAICWASWPSSTKRSFTAEWSAAWDRWRPNVPAIRQRSRDDPIALVMASDMRSLGRLFSPIPVVPDLGQCETCGSPMSPHPLKRFCSNSCRLKARYARATRVVPLITESASVPSRDLVDEPSKPHRSRQPVPAPTPMDGALRASVPTRTTGA